MCKGKMTRWHDGGVMKPDATRKKSMKMEGEDAVTEIYGRCVRATERDE